MQVGPASTSIVEDLILHSLDIEPGISVTFHSTKDKVDALWDAIEGQILDDGVSYATEQRMRDSLEWAGELYPMARTGAEWGQIHTALLYAKAMIHEERLSNTNRKGKRA